MLQYFCDAREYFEMSRGPFINQSLLIALFFSLFLSLLPFPFLVSEQKLQGYFSLSSSSFHILPRISLASNDQPRLCPQPSVCPLGIRSDHPLLQPEGVSGGLLGIINSIPALQ